MKSQFPEFAVASNTCFMFHQVQSDIDMVRYNVYYHKDMAHVAVVRFYEDNGDPACQLVDLDEGVLSTLKLSDVATCDGTCIERIWKDGFNTLAEEARKKLKLKIN